MADRESAEQVAQVVIRGLMAGKTVEIDGLGVFYPDDTRYFRFEERRLPQVFLAYVDEDRQAAERLYETLEAAGFAPWMDKRKLLPGQNWPRAIEGAIEASDFFVACFSQNSRGQEGRIPGGDPVCARLRTTIAVGRDFSGAGAFGRVPAARCDRAGVSICGSATRLVQGNSPFVGGDAERTGAASHGAAWNRGSPGVAPLFRCGGNGLQLRRTCRHPPPNAAGVPLQARVPLQAAFRHNLHSGLF